MKNLKKFLAFALATALIAGTVFFVTPSLKSYATTGSTENSSTGSPENSSNTQQETQQNTSQNTSQTTSDAPAIKLTAEAAKVYVGGEMQLRATLVNINDPTNSLVSAIHWSVKDPSLFEVWPFASSCWIYAVKPGTTDVIATLNYDGKTLSAKCTVTVPTESSKQNATKKSYPSTSSSTEVALPANITSADGKPLTMFKAVDGSNTLMTGAVGLIPSGAKLSAVEAAPTSQTFSVATAIMAIWRPNAEVKKVYDFNVFSKQATIIKTLDGKVCMSLPMPSDLTVPEGMVLKVYKFNDDGSVTICETLINQGRVVWGTDSFGTFAFVVEKATKAKRR